MPRKLVMKMTKVEVDEEGPVSAIDTETSGRVSIKEFKQAPVLGCSQSECEVLGDKLQLCARCKTVRYCSKACQKADWAKHKPQCELSDRMMQNSFLITGLPQKETKLQRNLRNFTARYEISLMAALICALDLRNNPKNISNLAVLVTIVPRCTSKTACFVLEDVNILPMATFERLVNNMKQVLDMHKIKREELQRESKGEQDYGTMAVFASNTGPGKLENDLDGEYRFKPLCISWRMVRSSRFYADKTLDWRQSLRIQIDQDLPNRPM